MELPSRAGPERGLLASVRGGELWLVAALSLIPHLLSLRGGFVYDDFRFVAENPGVHTLATPWTFFTDAERGSDPPDRDVYRPLRALGFAIQWRCFSGSAHGFHAVSLLLHLCLVQSLLLCFGRFSPSPPKRIEAAVLGLLFGAHPLTVECVSWISSQGDLLALLLVLRALATVNRSVVLATALAALAPFAKESALPVVVLLPLAVGRGRGAKDTNERGSKRQAIAVLLALLLASAVHLFLRQSALGRGFGLGAQGLSQVDASLGQRLALAAQSLWIAVRFFLVPYPQAVDTNHAPHLRTELHEWIAAALLLAAALVAVVRARRVPSADRSMRANAVAFGLFLLLPVCGLFAPLRSPYAERFLLPTTAALAVISTTFAPLVRSRTSRVFAGLVLAVLATRTGLRTLDWRDSQSLFRAELAVHPASIQARLGLADVSSNAGDPATARLHLEFVVEHTSARDPRHAGALSELARIALAEANDERALGLLQQAVQAIRELPPEDLDPRLDRVFVTLGDVLRRRASPQDAEAVLSEGVLRFGRTTPLLEGLAVCRDLLGDPLGALALYDEAAARGESSATHHYHRAIALQHLNRLLEARQALLDALSVDPGHRGAAQRLRDLPDHSSQPPDSASPDR